MSELKKLSFKDIKREANEYNRKEEYELDNKYKIGFYPLFSHSKIEELLEEYQKDLVYAEEKGINLIQSDHFVYSYIVFLAVKYFTDLGRDISAKVEEKVIQMKHLKDTGYLSTFANEIFMQSELEKIFDYMSQIHASSMLLDKTNEKAMDKLAELEFKNKELLEQLGDNESELEEKIMKLREAKRQQES